MRTRNLMDGLPLPEGPRAERDILESPDEARWFLEAVYSVDSEPPSLGPAWSTDVRRASSDWQCGGGYR